MIRRDAFIDRVRDPSSLGFKILVDPFTSGDRSPRFVEIPFRLRTRRAGESKLDRHVARDFGMPLLDKPVERWIPVRFVSFALIGGLGAVVHMGVLSALRKGGLASFASGQSAATVVAMAWGLPSFMLAWGVGAIANVGVAQYLFSHRQGWIPAALAGIVVGAVWNFATSSFCTWGKRARHEAHRRDGG